MLARYMVPWNTTKELRERENTIKENSLKLIESDVSMMSGSLHGTYKKRLVIALRKMNK